jgi:hypothetical protein
MQKVTGLAGVMALAITLLVLAGRAALLADAPSTEDCVGQWNVALNDGTVSLDVRPRRVFLSRQGADWDGQYPVCWLTIVESDQVCQSFHTLAGDANRWGSDPIASCDLPHRVELDTGLQLTSDGRLAIRER